MDVAMERDHARVDRLEKRWIMLECVLQGHRHRLYGNAAAKEISKALMPWAEGTSSTRGWAGGAKPGSTLRSG